MLVVLTTLGGIVTRDLLALVLTILGGCLVATGGFLYSVPAGLLASGVYVGVTGIVVGLD